MYIDEPRLRDMIIGQVFCVFTLKDYMMTFWQDHVNLSGYDHLGEILHRRQIFSIYVSAPNPSLRYQD
jgi:hypothetical protein